MKIQVFALAFLISVPVSAGEVLLREEFNSLERWSPLTFPKIKSHSRYSVIKEKNNGVLLCESDSSASGLIFKESFDVYKYPVVRWRWKVDNVYSKGDASRKSGDDYPIRVYVMFRYDPSSASAADRAKYGAAKLIYGEYPPHSSLNYIWASRQQGKRYIISPYTDRARMVVLRYGTTETKKWVDEKIDIIADYRRAFGTDPPSMGGIAVMNDSDNTGESSRSYIDFIEIRGR